MSTKITANNYAQAHAEMQSIDKDVAEQLPKEINAGDRDYYVVALVKKLHLPEEEKYVTSFNIQQFDSKSFGKTTKPDTLTTLGFSKAIVLNDPTLNTPLDETAQATASTGVLSKEEKDKIITDAKAEALADAKANPDLIAEAKNELKAELKPAVTDELKGTAGEAASTDVQKLKEAKEKDLSGLKLEDLLNFAKENEIELSGITKKEDVLTALTTWQAEAIEEDETKE